MILTNPDGPMRVAYVEDDPQEAQAFAESYRAQGFSNPLDHYASGEALIQELVSPFPKTPGVVLVDLALPGISGVETMHILRQEQRLAQLPCFVITASEQRTAEQAMDVSGAAGYLLKPMRGPNFLMLMLDIRRKSPRFKIRLERWEDEQP